MANRVRLPYSNESEMLLFLQPADRRAMYQIRPSMLLNIQGLNDNRIAAMRRMDQIVLREEMSPYLRAEDWSYKGTILDGTLFVEMEWKNPPAKNLEKARKSVQTLELDWDASLSHDVASAIANLGQRRDYNVFNRIFGLSDLSEYYDLEHFLDQDIEDKVRDNNPHLVLIYMGYLPRLVTHIKRESSGEVYYQVTYEPQREDSDNQLFFIDAGDVFIVHRDSVEDCDAVIRRAIDRLLGNTESHTLLADDHLLVGLSLEPYTAPLYYKQGKCLGDVVVVDGVETTMIENINMKLVDMNMVIVEDMDDVGDALREMDFDTLFYAEDVVVEDEALFVLSIKT